MKRVHLWLLISLVLGISPVPAERPGGSERPGPPAAEAPAARYLGNGGDLFVGECRFEEEIHTATDVRRLRHREEIARAMLEQKRGYLAVALQSLEKALKNHPQSVVALTMMAEITYQDNPVRAQHLLDQAGEIDPDYYRLHLVQAYLYKKQGKTRRTIESLNRTLELKPTHNEARRERAALLQRQVNNPQALRQAIEDYQILQQALPQQSPLWNYYIGVCYFHLKEFKRAEKVLEPLLGQTSGGEVALILGQCKAELGDYEGALEYLSRTRSLPARKSMAEIALQQADSSTGEIRLRYLNTYLEEIRQVLLLPVASRDPEDFLQAGKAALELRRVNVAVNYLRTYLKLVPDGEVARPYLLHALILTGDPGEEKEIESLYEAYVSSRPATETISIRFDYARYQMALKQWDKALKELGKIEEVLPGNGRSVVLRAQIAFRSGNFEECIRTADRAIELMPGKRDEILVLKGQAYLEAGSAEAALQTFQEAVEAADESRKALRHFEIGEVYRDRGLLDETLKHWEETLRQSPSNESLRYEVGRVYYQKGDFEKAAEHFERVARDGNDREMQSRADILLGYIRMMQGNLDEAEKKFKEALEFSPSNYYAFTGLAHLLADQERYQEARENFERAVHLNPNDATLLIQLGVTCDNLNDVECAEEVAHKAIELDPDYAEAYNFLGYLYAERGIKLDEAVEYIEKAMELQPNDPNITDSLGWAYFKKGEVQKAIELLETAVSLLNDENKYGSSVILEHLGDAYHEAGELEKAREMWKKAAEGVPNSETALEKLSAGGTESTGE